MLHIQRKFYSSELALVMVSNELLFYQQTEILCPCAVYDAPFLSLQRTWVCPELFQRLEQNPVYLFMFLNRGVCHPEPCCFPSLPC